MDFNKILLQNQKPLYFDKIKSDYFLALDIGTEAIKSIIFQKPVFRKEESIKFVILGKHQEYFERSDVFNLRDFGEINIKNKISESIKGAYYNFLQNFGRKTNIQINDLPILVSLSPNILKEKIIFQSFERENQELKISNKEEAEIYKTVSQKARNKILIDFSQQFGIMPDDIQFLSSKILEIKFDGYNITKLEGFKGKKLDFRLILSFLFKSYLKNIEKIFGNFKLNIPGLLNKSQNLSYLFSDKDGEAIFLDVGGEISQLFLVKKGKIDLIFEFDNGGFDFTERISKILGLNLEDSRNLKHNYSNLLLSEEVRKKVREILSEERQSWFESLKKSLRIILLEQKTILPNYIILFGGGSLLPEIQEILEEGNWEELPFFSQPKVKLFHPQDLKIIEDRTKGLISTQDINLILACLPIKKDSFFS